MISKIVRIPSGAGLTYAGMYYILVDNDGDVWQTPDYHGRHPLGNVLKNNVRLFTEPGRL